MVGCNEKAKHTYKAPDGLGIHLCDKHYEEWKESENKRPLKTVLKGYAKWSISLLGVLVMIPAGVLFIGFVVYALVYGLPISYSFRIGLIFTEIPLQGEGAGTPLIFGIVILLVGIVLTYIGFKKME
jgi:hypothetical protein